MFVTTVTSLPSLGYTVLQGSNAMPNLQTDVPEKTDIGFTE